MDVGVGVGVGVTLAPCVTVSTVQGQHPHRR